MAERYARVADLTFSSRPRRMARWPGWVGYTAATWSLIYGALGLWWALGGAGFPFGTANDREAAAKSILGGARAGTAGPVIAGLGLVAAVAALAMVRGRGSRGRGILRATLLVFAWSICVVLLVVIPDTRVLRAAAYAPVFLVGAPFGWPPANYFEVALPWPVINQVLCMAGGFLWAGTAVAYRRRIRGACITCGRADDAFGSGTVGEVGHLRCGHRAPPVRGDPLGVGARDTARYLRGVPPRRTGDRPVVGGAALSTVDVAGAILTFGLVQRWGEVFPRWMVGLSGKRVPPALAIVPASLVSVMVTSAGFPAQGWATTAPGLLWPLWGVALGAATLAYHYRRRGRCARCGRGEDHSMFGEKGIVRW